MRKKEHFCNSILKRIFALMQRLCILNGSMHRPKRRDAQRNQCCQNNIGRNFQDWDEIKNQKLVDYPNQNISAASAHSAVYV